jgi:cysteine desulfurase
MDEEEKRTAALRDRLVTLIREDLPETRLNGDPERRLPGNASLTFPGAPADRVIAELRDIALSTGSACSSSTPATSHVLTAIGLDRAAAGSTLRIGVGRFTTLEEIEYAARRIAGTVARTRDRIPVTHQETDRA